jgi:AbrB family looped-hinge helix DNA binding protein
MQTEKDKYLFGVVKVGDKGQVVIPKEAREVFGIKAGDSLLVLGDVTKGLALVKTQIFDSAVEEVFK